MPDADTQQLDPQTAIDWWIGWPWFSIWLGVTLLGCVSLGHLGYLTGHNRGMADVTDWILQTQRRYYGLPHAHDIVVGADGTERPLEIAE